MDAYVLEVGDLQRGRADLDLGIPEHPPREDHDTPSCRLKIPMWAVSVPEEGEASGKVAVLSWDLL